MLFQLRSGHAPLNAHLHHFKCTDSPTCEACGEADETVYHFIYDCPARLGERRRLKTAAGKRWHNRAYLLSNEKGINALMAYVRETGRMRGKRDDEDGRPEGGTGRATGQGAEETQDEQDEEEDREDGRQDAGDGQGGGEDEGMEGLLRWFRVLTKGTGEDEGV